MKKERLTLLHWSVIAATLLVLAHTTVAMSAADLGEAMGGTSDVDIDTTGINNSESAPEPESTSEGSTSADEGISMSDDKPEVFAENDL
jgi:hypothetical protein